MADPSISLLLPPNPSPPPLPPPPLLRLPPTLRRRRRRLGCAAASASPSAAVAAGEGEGDGSIRWGCEIESMESAGALQRWLSASGLPQQKMAIRRVEVGERGLVALKNIRKGEKLLFVPPSLVISPDSVYNTETFRWSFGILFSRLVRLPSMDGKVALVPWADMLNHSSEVETFLDYDKSSQGIVFTTDRSYQPGEQVFISYGKKSNGELLLSYGFVPKEGTNPNDSVELSMSVDKSDKCYEAKQEALKKYGLSTSERFPLQITGWPLEMMAYAYLVVSPPNMSRHFEEMAAAASNKGTAKAKLNYPELEEQTLQFILDCCESSISKHNKFVEGGATFDSIAPSAKQANRKVLLKQLATDLCISERRILYRAQYILRRRLRDMRSGELRALTILNGFRKLFK